MSTSGTNADTNQRAVAAVKVFRAMLPSITSYARAITGNPRLKITITNDNGSSIRDQIFFMPPIELGDKTPHQKSLCDRRDSTGKALCAACEVRASAMAVIYHEIGHIAKGTHGTPLYGEENWVRTECKGYHPKFKRTGRADWNSYFKSSWTKRVDAGAATYMSLLNLVNPYLPKLFNVTEDARVNEQMFRARAGIRPMYDVMVRNVLANGVPIPGTDEKTYWRDCAFEYQILLAVYAHLAGYDYEGWFSDETWKTMQNGHLRIMLERFSYDFTAYDNLEYTVSLFRLLQQMGFFPDEPNDEEEKEDDDNSGDPGDSDDSEDSSGDRSDSEDGKDDGGDPDKSEDGSDSVDDASTDETGAGGSSEGDKPEYDPSVDSGADEGKGGIKLASSRDRSRLGGSPEEIVICNVDDDLTVGNAKTDEQKAEEDEAMKRAVVQAAYFETEATGIEGVIEMVEGDDEWDKYQKVYRSFSEEPDVSPGALSRAVLHARIAFEDNRRHKSLNHLKSGRVNGRVLGKRASIGDERLFRKRIVPGKRDYHVVIGLDLSYSTAGLNLSIEKSAAYAQAELLSRLGISFSMYGHSGGYGSLLVFKIKTEHEPWNTQVKNRLKAIQPVGANLDGHFLEYLRKRADESVATDTVILYYSDGKMPAENHDEELEVLQREIKTCKRKGYALIGVGIRTDSPSRHGLETVQIDTADDVRLVVDFLKRKMMETL